MLLICLSSLDWRSKSYHCVARHLSIVAALIHGAREASLGCPPMSAVSPTLHTNTSFSQPSFILAVLLVDIVIIVLTAFFAHASAFAALTSPTGESPDTEFAFTTTSDSDSFGSFDHQDTKRAEASISEPFNPWSARHQFALPWFCAFLVCAVCVGLRFIRLPLSYDSCPSSGYRTTYTILTALPWIGRATFAAVLWVWGAPVGEAKHLIDVIVNAGRLRRVEGRVLVDKERTTKLQKLTGKGVLRRKYGASEREGREGRKGGADYWV
ncbi:hypothetical protein IWZ00DRAFT_177408 [Phyllosticta capitalensis]